MRVILILLTVLSFSEWCRGDEIITIPIARRIITPPITQDGSLNTMVRNQYFAGTLRNYASSTDNTTTMTSFATSQQEHINNYYTLVYTARVSIGTPAQNFDVVFDTGSADLWVVDAAVSGHVDYMHYFNTKASTTLRQTKAEWTITYGTGDATGYQARDTLTLMGLQAPNYLFGLANSFARDVFQNALEPMDGIMGLAMSPATRISPDPKIKGVTVIDALKTAGQISRKTFSFVLDPSDDGTSSLFILGGVPDEITKQYAPNGFAQVTVANPPPPQEEGMWWVPMQSASVGGNSFSCTTSCVALVDTGTSLITTPQAFFNMFASQVTTARSDCSSSDGKRVWCTEFTYDKLPLMIVTLGGTPFVIFPADYTIVNGNRLMLGITALQFIHPPQNRFILGDVFLKQHYSVFDMENQNISIAKDYDKIRPSKPEKRTITTTSSAWIYILIIAAFAAGVIGMFMLYRYYRNRRMYLQNQSGLLQNAGNVVPPSNAVPLSQRTGGYRLGGASAVPPPYRPPVSDRQQPLLSDATESGY